MRIRFVGALVAIIVSIACILASVEIPAESAQSGTDAPVLEIG